MGSFRLTYGNLNERIIKSIELSTLSGYSNCKNIPQYIFLGESGSERSAGIYKVWLEK